MVVYYYKLWELLERRNLSQRELTRQLHISTATLTRMRKDQSVSLETLEQIRNYLNCDYGDMITAVPPEDSLEIDWQKEAVVQHTNEVCRQALSEYMTKNRLTARIVAERTCLSLNTVKEFLRGKELSYRSVRKLIRLDREYQWKVQDLLDESEEEV